jgi:predicted metal-dependent HD superfamily phosphohydrolase
LERVLNGIEKWKYRFTQNEFEQLVLAAFFHDAIYDARNPRENEDKSIKFFMESYIGKDKRFDLVGQAIECTKYRKRPTHFPLRVFWDADNAGFRDRWEDFLKYEKAIRKEYSFLDDDIYKNQRIRFLEKNIGIFGVRGNSNIKKLIKKIGSNI